MGKNIAVSLYHDSKSKLLFNSLFAVFCQIILLPVFLLISLLLKIANGGPVFFIQKRTGKNGKVFKMIKFRTMKVGSEKLQNKYRSINEADGPVFKIYNDPRLTPIGKILSQTGLDEIPQLINVLKGDMSIVGPRPLPVEEAKKLTKTQKIRQLVNPGITSSWVVEGSHSLSFKKWMELDKDYVENANLTTDITISVKTFLIVFRQLFR